jgi:hypothetical protein
MAKQQWQNNGGKATVAKQRWQSNGGKATVAKLLSRLKFA